MSEWFRRVTGQQAPNAEAANLRAPLTGREAPQPSLPVARSQPSMPRPIASTSPQKSLPSMQPPTPPAGPFTGQPGAMEHFDHAFGDTTKDTQHYRAAIKEQFKLADENLSDTPTRYVVFHTLHTAEKTGDANHVARMTRHLSSLTQFSEKQIRSIHEKAGKDHQIGRQMRLKTGVHYCAESHGIRHVAGPWEPEIKNPVTGKMLNAQPEIAPQALKADHFDRLNALVSQRENGTIDPNVGRKMAKVFVDIKKETGLSEGEIVRRWSAQRAPDLAVRPDPTPSPPPQKHNPYMNNYDEGWD